MTFDIFGTRARAERDEALRMSKHDAAYISDLERTVKERTHERDVARGRVIEVEGERDAAISNQNFLKRAAENQLARSIELRVQLIDAKGVIAAIIKTASTKNPNATVLRILKLCGVPDPRRAKIRLNMVAMRAHTASIRAGVGQ